MKRTAPGRHVSERRGTHEKLEGQLELDLRAPKKDLFAYLYGGRPNPSFERDFMRQLVTYGSAVAITDLEARRLRPLWDVVPLGRWTGGVTDSITGRRVDVAILDDLEVA